MLILYKFIFKVHLVTYFVVLAILVCRLYLSLPDDYNPDSKSIFFLIFTPKKYSD